MCGSIFAQYESHWPDFYYPNFQSQNICVTAIAIDGEIVTADNHPDNWNALEIAFFVGDECRGAGVAFGDYFPAWNYLYNGYVEEYGDPFPVIDGAPVYYNDEGEVVTVKMYDHVNGIEYNECTITLLGEPYVIYTGEDNDQGWYDPENPIILDFTTQVCPRPGEVTVSDITASGATVSWTENGTATAWQICLNNDETSLVDINEPYYSITGLNGGAQYTVKVRAICDSGVSAWSAVKTFTTVFARYESHWPQFYYPAFMYQAPFVAAIEIDGVIVTAENHPDNWNALEIAFFVGDECRGAGVAFGDYFPAWNYLYNGYVEEYGDPFPVIDGAPVYYNDEGEVVTVKMYDHVNGIEYNECTITLLGEPYVIYTGEDNDQGWYDPENPIILDFTTQVCPRPGEVTVSDITASGATVSWTENGTATAWQICLNNDTNSLINVTTNPYMLTGLTPETVYTVNVRANCGQNGESRWSIPVTFTTKTCRGIIALPYTEDFEGYTESTTASTGVQPDCWNLVQSDVPMTDANRPQLYYKSAYAHSGSYSLLLNYRGVYAMPAVSESVPMNRVRLEMYLRQPKAYYAIEVGVYEDDGTFVPVTTFNNSGTGIELVGCDFSSYTGNGRRIAFRNVLGGGANYNYSYNYIDDIVLTEICDPVSLPYTEDFESYTASTTASTGVQPDCWNLVQSDVPMTDANRPQLYYKSAYAHSGSYSLLLNYRGVYAMPAVSESVPMNRVKLEMYLRQPKAAYQLEVGVYENDGTFVPVTTFNNSGTGVEFVECDFSSYTGTGRRIAFRNISGDGTNYNYSYNYIDDIVLTENCDPISLPYTEDFESYTASTTASTGVQPDCWNLVQSDVPMTDANRPQLYYKSAYAHSGSYSLLLNYRGVYAMPAVSENVPMNRMKLEMYLRQPKAAYQLEVGVYENDGTFVPVTTFNNSGTGVEFVECNFSSYTGNGRRIAFRNVLGGGANYNYSYNYIDDIVLTYLCEPIVPPYSENFESYTESTTASTGVQPACWELVRTDVAMTDATQPQLYYKSTYAHSGNYSLKMGYRGVYAMPTLSEEVPMNNVRLEMYLRQPNAAYQLEVGVWDGQEFVPVKRINNSSTDVERVECNFSTYTGNGHRIAFRNVLGGGANYAYSYNYIDDIVLTVCNPISLPYYENFESFTESTTASTGMEPDCWDLVREDVAITDVTRPQLYYKSSYAHSGNYSLKMGYRGVYAMPTLSEEVPMNNVRLEMYLRQPNAAYQLEVGVWDGQEFVPVKRINNSSTDVERVECNFSTYTGSGRRIAFRNVLGGGANYDYSYNYIDDIVLIGCNPISLPYFENFESFTESTTASTGVEPDCWDLVREDVAITDATRPQLYYKSSYAHSGNYSLKMGYRGIYAMPTLSEEVPMNGVKLEMYLRQPNAAYQLEVGVWDGQEFVPVKRINNSSTNVERVECNFSTYTGSGRRIAFRNVLGGGANYDYSYNYIDDIKLSTIFVVDEKSCPGSELVTDIDGNIYSTVQIGQQCWMRENLRTTKDVNGTPIPASDAMSYVIPYYYDYSSSGIPLEERGYLYNWLAALVACPAGWHLPSDAEWNTMEATVSGSDWQTSYETYINKRGNHAGKLAGGDNWATSTTSGAPGDYGNAERNVSGFSAVPAGVCGGSSFYYAGGNAYFWSATQYYASDPYDAYIRYLFYDGAGVTRYKVTKTSGISVRCVRDETGTAVIDSKSCPGTPTVTDHEGNVYATVQIGNQCWMRDNLRTTTSPSTGTYLIPAAGTDCTYTGKQAFYAPMNYGLLYNWNAAVDTFNTAYGETCVNTDDNNAVSVTFSGHRRGICPVGWHLPSDAEWNTMERTVSDTDWQTSYGLRGNHAGKLAGGDSWSSSTTFGAPGDYSNTERNSSGFSVVPAGYCNGSSFYTVSYFAYFWSATQYASDPNDAYIRILGYDYAGVSRCGDYKYRGFSVRCLRDNPNNKSGESNEDPNSAIPDDTSLEMADIDAPLGVNDFTDGTMDIILYPNPTRDVVNVQCTMNNVQCSGIEVIDVYGKVVRNVVETMCTSSLQTRINVSDLAAGMYFVRVTTDRGVVTKPFVKR